MEENLKIPDINGLVGTLLAIGAKVWSSGGNSPHNIIIYAENINIGKIQGNNFVARKHLDVDTKIFNGDFSYEIIEEENGIAKFVPMKVYTK